MADIVRRPLFLVLSVLIGFTIPLPTLGTRLFDLSSQIDTINQISQLPDCSDSIDTFFDTVTTLPVFEKTCQSIPEINTLDQQARLLISAQHTMIYLLIPLMTMVKRYQAYWQEQLHRPYAYFLSKPPHKWFRCKPQKEDLQDTLRMLTIIENNIAEHIGTLKNQLDEYAMVKTHAELQEIVEHQQMFLVAFFGDSLQSDFKANITLIVSGFIQYHQSMYALARSYKRANHFSRNWIAYTTAGLCLGAATCWYFKNPDANKAWINSVIEKRTQEMSHFWQEYIKKPLLKIYEEVFRKPPLQSAQEDIDLLRAANNFFTKYGLSSQVRYLPKYQNLENAITNKNPQVPAMIKEIADEAIPEIQHILTVLGFKEISISSIISSSALNAAKDAVLLQYLIEKRSVYSIRDTLNLIMPFIAIIPACALAYFSLTGTKAAYQKLAPHKTAHQGILITLLQVEELLNNNAHKDALETKELGMLTYYLGLLYEYSQDLSMQEHYDFCKDLNKLFNTTHTMSQKLKDIDIIRKKYQFLA